MGNEKHKEFTVYVPCIYTEIHYVEATTAQEALELVKGGLGNCIGEVRTGREHEGFRVVEGKK